MSAAADEIRRLLDRPDMPLPFRPIMRRLTIPLSVWDNSAAPEEVVDVATCPACSQRLPVDRVTGLCLPCHGAFRLIWALRREL